MRVMWRLFCEGIVFLNKLLNISFTQQAFPFPMPTDGQFPCPVIMVHKSPPTLLEARGPYENILNKVKIAKGDITDMSFLINTVKKYCVKRIIHTVAVMSEILESDPQKALRLNIQGDINVLEVARLLDIERVKSKILEAPSAVLAVEGR